MRFRLSLTGQLLALQLAIVTVVLIGVASVTVAQSVLRSRDVEARQARAVAETVAGTSTVRAYLQGSGNLALLSSIAESNRRVSGSSDVVIADESRLVLASADPGLLGRRLDLHGSPVLAGRGWVGTVERSDGRSVVAHVPVMSERPGSVGDVIGIVAVSGDYPTVLDGLRQAAPNLLTYLGLASVVGVLGSLLLARRVKRQTFGLDPVEIAGLVEHRGAMLYGIREGVIGVDLQGRVTLMNDEARKLLNVSGDAVGRTLVDLPLEPALRDALSQPAEQPDQVVPAGDRILIVNTLPIATRGVRIGSVTTLRDRTELLALQRELDVTRSVTDTLRAQGHEFSNRLHTISGLIELGEYAEVAQYVQRLDAGVSRTLGEITSRVADPAVAALLVAKGSQADERGVRFTVADSTRLGRLDDELSTDAATTIGNLVDNAFDAVSDVPGERWVEVEAVERPEEITITVRDSGPGVAPEAQDAVFRRGYSTKGGAQERGIGLALVQLVCQRRGGDVTVHNEGGAVFTATLPTRSRVAS